MIRKKWFVVILSIFVLATFTGCDKLPSIDLDLAGKKAEKEAEKEANTKSESKSKKDTGKDLLAKMNVREDILSAMDAAKKLSGGDFVIASDGGYYYTRDCRNYAYAYYGEPVTGVYADASSDPFVLAVLEDGSVYNGTTLITEGAGIRDVCWKTHSTNIDAYLLGKDGKIYFYNPYNEHNENEFEDESDYENITAICRAGSYGLFFRADGQVLLPNIFMSGGSAKWKNVEANDWKEIVVAACAYDDRKDVYTIAGISADGTVHATGTYAEDILAMGELSYITMFDDASLIVGLTPDGMLKFAGSNAENYAGIQLNDIAGVKAFDDRVWAIGTDGSVYMIKHGDNVVTLTKNGSNGSYRCFYMGTEGDVFTNENNIWTKTNELNAGVADHTSLLYYLELSKQKFNDGRGFMSSYTDLEDRLFMMFDLNGDGQDEIFIPSGMSIYIGCIYNGTLSTSMYTNDIVGYYPESQVLVTVRYGGGSEYYDYGYLINGIYTIVATWKDYHLEGKEPYEMYEFYIDKKELPDTDEEGERLREEDKQAMSKGEFNALLEHMVEEEPMVKWETDFWDYRPCTKENYAAVFLNGMDIPEDETSAFDSAELNPAAPGLSNSPETEMQPAQYRDYIIPNSSSAYLTQNDVAGLSAEELRIARNEIYARHGRKFQSQDLQEYFESKVWYHGFIEPSDFKESLLNDFEKKNAAFIKKAEENAPSRPLSEASSIPSNLPDAPSKGMIDRYGYENGHSTLSFRILKGTLKDCGEYYQVDAVYQQGVEAPANLREGERVTLVFNELTGETKTLIYRNDRFYPEGADAYDPGYYYYPTSDGRSVILYQYSEDRIDKPIYEGKLYIRKDATKEVAIVNQVQAVTKENLNAEDWYNGVYFDEKGYVTRLVFYGD